MKLFAELPDGKDVGFMEKFINSKGEEELIVVATDTTPYIVNSKGEITEVTNTETKDFKFISY